MDSNFSDWNKDLIRLLIEEYEKRPCLWKIKSEVYHDRRLKATAYQSLLEKIKDSAPEATIKLTLPDLKKIDNLRSSFRREHNKVVTSMKSGAGAEEVYAPA